jgi:hypothetical protein
MVESDPALARVLKSTGANRANLQEGYEWLLTAGAGQWCRGHWVAASAFVFPPALEYVLTGIEGRTKNDWQTVAFRLVEYFENGEVGRIVR